MKNDASHYTGISTNYTDNFSELSTKNAYFIWREYWLSVFCSYSGGNVMAVRGNQFAQRYQRPRGYQGPRHFSGRGSGYRRPPQYQRGFRGLPRTGYGGGYRGGFRGGY